MECVEELKFFRRGQIYLLIHACGTHEKCVRIRLMCFQISIAFCDNKVCIFDAWNFWRRKYVIVVGFSRFPCYWWEITNYCFRQNCSARPYLQTSCRVISHLLLVSRKIKESRASHTNFALFERVLCGIKDKKKPLHQIRSSTKICYLLSVMQKSWKYNDKTYSNLNAFIQNDILSCRKMR